MVVNHNPPRGKKSAPRKGRPLTLNDRKEAWADAMIARAVVAGFLGGWTQDEILAEVAKQASALGGVLDRVGRATVGPARVRQIYARTFGRAAGMKPNPRFQREIFTKESLLRMRGNRSLQQVVARALGPRRRAPEDQDIFVTGPQPELTSKALHYLRDFPMLRRMRAQIDAEIEALTAPRSLDRPKK